MFEEPSPPSPRLIALSKSIYFACYSRSCLHPVHGATFLHDFQNSLLQATRDDVNDLLIEPNWRTRVVGAYFAAFNGWNEFEETIGRLLVKDDLIFASIGYCFALCSFSSVRASNYLCTYLYNNYAGRCTDMSSIAYAVGGIKYLDERRGTSFFDENIGIWHQKIEERTHGFFPFYKPHDDLIWAKEYLRDTLTPQKVEANRLWAQQMLDCIKQLNATNYQS